MTAPSPSTTSTPPEAGAAATDQKLTFKRVIIALVVVNIWIVTLCTAPHLAGMYLYRWFDYSGDLPLRSLSPVALNAMAVLGFLLFARRTDLLAWRRPKNPAFILVLLPLVAINFTRGPLGEFGTAALLVLVLSNCCTGFWEEFLFRGLIQERLALLGPRTAVLSTALLFTFIHWHKGFWQCFIVFAIGLTFCLARSRIGMWPLVIIHSSIDLTRHLFERQWAGYGPSAKWLIYSYLALCAVLLLRTKKSKGGEPLSAPVTSGD